MLKPLRKDDYSSSIQRHLTSMHELIQLSIDLDSMQVDYIVLKGTPLNQLLYEDKLVRLSRDVDILIQSNNIQTVHDYLLARGYQLQPPFKIAHLIDEPTGLLNYLDEVLYWHPLKAIALDLKWHTSSRNCYGMAWCDIKNHVVVHMNTHPIKILNPEENFYYLCVHAAKHCWEYRQWLQDLVVFSQKFHPCWDKIMSLAQHTQAIRPVLEARALLQEKFHIQLKDIPYSFLDSIVVQFRLYLMKSNWFDGLRDGSKSKRYCYIILDLCLYPKISQKYHYMKRLFVVRTASLRQVSRFKNPKLYKMILYSFFPTWDKSR